MSEPSLQQIDLAESVSLEEVRSPYVCHGSECRNIAAARSRDI